MNPTKNSAQSSPTIHNVVHSAFSKLKLKFFIIFQQLNKSTFFLFTFRYSPFDVFLSTFSYSMILCSTFSLRYLIIVILLFDIFLRFLSTFSQFDVLLFDIFHKTQHTCHCLLCRGSIVDQFFSISNFFQNSRRKKDDWSLKWFLLYSSTSR